MLGLQLLPRHPRGNLRGIDLLDPTKLVPEELAPVQLVGKLTLDRNPTNDFAARIDAALCAAVAGGLGLPVPDAEPVSDVLSSPALSQVSSSNPAPIAGRVIGVVAGPKVDLAGIAMLRKALTAHGAVLRVIAPVGGVLDPQSARSRGAHAVDDALHRVRRRADRRGPWRPERRHADRAAAGSIPALQDPGCLGGRARCSPTPGSISRPPASWWATRPTPRTPLRLLRRLACTGYRSVPRL